MCRVSRPCRCDRETSRIGTRENRPGSMPRFLVSSKLSLEALYVRRLSSSFVSRKNGEASFNCSLNAGRYPCRRGFPRKDLSIGVTSSPSVGDGDSSLSAASTARAELFSQSSKAMRPVNVNIITFPEKAGSFRIPDPYGPRAMLICRIMVVLTQWPRQGLTEEASPREIWTTPRVGFILA